MSNYYYDKYTAVTIYTVGGTYQGEANTNAFTNQYPSYGFDNINNVYSIVGSMGTQVWTLSSVSYLPNPPYECWGYISTGVTNRWAVYDYKSMYSQSHWAQGSLVQASIIAPDGTYPDNGYNSADGYWYVKGALAFPPLKININGALKTAQDGWVNVNGVLRHIEGMWINVNGVLKKL